MEYNLYIPKIDTPNPPVMLPEGNGDDGGDGESPVLVWPSAQHEELYWLLKTNKAQQRQRFVAHPILMAVAQARAEDCLSRSYAAHVDPEGFGPNYHVRQAGYVLPENYHTSDNANNIESLAAGQVTPAEVMDGWYKSPFHWLHVMGLSKTYSLQTEVGIGYVMDMGAERYNGRMWVLITCPRMVMVTGG